MGINFKKAYTLHLRLVESVKNEFFIALLVFILIGNVFLLPSILNKKTILPTNVIIGLDSIYKGNELQEQVSGNSLLSDLTQYVYPSIVFTKERIDSGQLPMWNPYTMNGAPFIANGQSSVFDFTKIIGYFSRLDAQEIFESSLLFVIIFGGFFMYLFLRAFSVETFGALIGSVIFVLSGPMTAWLGYPLSSAFLWLPFILWNINNISTSRRVRWIVIGAIGVAAQFYSGQPQMSLLIFCIIAIFTLFLAYFQSPSVIKERAHYYFRLVSSVIIMIILGLSMAAPQVIPTVEYIVQSEALEQGRDPYLSLSTETVNVAEIPEKHNAKDRRSGLANFLVLLYPDFFGNPVSNSMVGVRSQIILNNNERAGFIGASATALAIVAVLFSKRKFSKYRTFWFLVAVFCLLIIVNFSFIGFIGYVFPFSKIKLERIRFVFVFSLAILAAIGADVMMEEVKKYLSNIKHHQPLSRPFYSNNIPIPPATILAYLSILVTLILPALWGYIVFTEVLMRDILWIFFVALLFICTVIIGIFHSKFNTFYIKAGLFMAVIAPLFYYAMILHPRSSRELVYPKTNALEFLQDHAGLYRFTSFKYKYYPTTAVIPNSSTIWHLQDIRGYDPLAPGRYQILQKHIRGIENNLVVADQRWYYAFFAGDAFRLMGVKYFVQSKNDLENIELRQRSDLSLVYSDDSVNIYENKSVLPRAFIAYNIQLVRSPEEALSTFTASQFNEDKTAILEDKQMPADLLNKVDASGDLISAANITEYQNEKVKIATDSQYDGLLVLTDSYYPGWRAYVDGKEQKIYPANIAFRGVFVPKGKHIVTFIYTPTFWTASVIFAILALTVVMVLLILDLLGSKSINKSLHSNAISQ